MKALLDRGLCALGVPAFFRWKNRKRLPILMYHGVVEEPLAPFCWHQLPVGAFRRQMEHVKKEYRVLALSEALARLEADDVPPRALAITFDDGFLNNRTVAFPILESLGLPATIFLVTSVIGTDAALWPDRVYLAFQRTRATELDGRALGLDRLPLRTNADRARAIGACLAALKATPVAEKNERLDGLLAQLGATANDDPGPFRLMGWGDVDALRNSGLVELGGHTTRHEILSQLPGEQVALEVRTSHKEVETRTGKTPVAFAYPNGRRIDYDARAPAAVRAVGVHWALTTEEGLAGRDSPPLELPRICVGADLSFARFRLLLSGAWSALRR